MNMGTFRAHCCWPPWTFHILSCVINQGHFLYITAAFTPKVEWSPIFGYEPCFLFSNNQMSKKWTQIIFSTFRNHLNQQEWWRRWDCYWCRQCSGSTFLTMYLILKCEIPIYRLCVHGGFFAPRFHGIVCVRRINSNDVTKIIIIMRTAVINVVWPRRFVYFGCQRTHKTEYTQYKNHKNHKTNNKTHP